MPSQLQEFEPFFFKLKHFYVHFHHFCNCLVTKIDSSSSQPSDHTGHYHPHTIPNTNDHIHYAVNIN